MDFGLRPQVLSQRVRKTHRVRRAPRDNAGGGLFMTSDGCLSTVPQQRQEPSRKRKAVWPLWRPQVVARGGTYPGQSTGGGAGTRAGEHEDENCKPSACRPRKPLWDRRLQGRAGRGPQPGRGWKERAGDCSAVTPGTIFAPSRAPGSLLPPQFSPEWGLCSDVTATFLTKQKPKPLITFQLTTERTCFCTIETF